MCTESGNGDRMRRAYGVSGRLFRDRLAQDRPDDERELRRVGRGEVVSVRGRYDHIHRVLEATGVPFLDVAPEDVERLDWDAMQVLLVNCPGELPAEALRRIPAWVRNGGYLVTTDWALKHVVEPLFPETIKHNGAQTADCVVRVTMSDQGDDPLLDGFLEDGRDPLWWLEGSSYPITVLDPSRVKVLARSGEVADRWGEDAVVATFEEGEGTVLHLLSHLYLQRSDVRGAHDAMAATAYMGEELGVAPAAVQAMRGDAEGLNAAEIRSALSKAGMISKVILRSRKKPRRKTESK